jgi:hypothetical protein
MLRDVPMRRHSPKPRVASFSVALGAHDGARPAARLVPLRAPRAARPTRAERTA